MKYFGLIVLWIYVLGGLGGFVYLFRRVVASKKK